MEIKKPMAANILEEAMADAKLLKKTAIENAKNVLVEAISPQIKEFVDDQIGESDINLEYLSKSFFFNFHILFLKSFSPSLVMQYPNPPISDDFLMQPSFSS